MRYQSLGHPHTIKLPFDLEVRIIRVVIFVLAMPAIAFAIDVTPANAVIPGGFVSRLVVLEFIGAMVSRFTLETSPTKSSLDTRMWGRRGLEP